MNQNTLSILAGIAGAGILVCVFLYFIYKLLKQSYTKKQEKDTEELLLDQIQITPPSQNDENAERWKRLYDLSEEYASLFDAHSLYYEKYEQLYSVLNNTDSLDGEEGDRLILILEQDINLVPMWFEYHKKRIEIDPSLSFPNEYSAFPRLAIVYEKRGQYDFAANVCKKAILYGFTSDRTKGGMYGRLARICKKGKLEITNYIDISDI